MFVETNNLTICGETDSICIFLFYLQVQSVRLIFRLPFPPLARIINEFEIESSRVESAWIGDMVIILYSWIKYYSTPIMKIVFSLLICYNRLDRHPFFPNKLQRQFYLSILFLI